MTYINGSILDLKSRNQENEKMKIQVYDVNYFMVNMRISLKFRDE